jgi:hypothetical protein
MSETIFQYHTDIWKHVMCKIKAENVETGEEIETTIQRYHKALVGNEELGLHWEIIDLLDNKKKPNYDDNRKNNSID